MAWPCRKVRKVKMDEEEPVKKNHDKMWRSKSKKRNVKMDISIL